MPANDQTSERTTSARKLKELCTLALNVKNRTTAASGELGEAIARAVENNHLDRKAFSMVKSLYISFKKDPAKASVVLRNFDVYREALAIDDMLSDELPLEQDEAETDDKPNGKRAKAKKGGKSGKGTKASISEAAERSQREVDRLKEKFSNGGAPAES